MTMNQHFPSTASTAGEGPSYFRAALTNPYNVILLAGSVSFSAAWASWVPLLSGLVGEALWLVAGPRLTAFRRHTDAQQQTETAAPASAAPLTPPPVAPEYAERVAAVESSLQRVEGLFGTRS